MDNIPNIFIYQQYFCFCFLAGSVPTADKEEGKLEDGGSGDNAGDVTSDDEAPGTDTDNKGENLTFRKIAIRMSKNCQKLDMFFKKIAKSFHFFQKNCQWQFF